MVLSRNDSAVLGALFDPEASLQNHAMTDERMLGPYDSTTLSKIKGMERTALRSINTALPTRSDLQQAISILTEITTSYPLHASAWNNRAQARRMLCVDDNADTQRENFPGVVEDLNRAIELASPKSVVHTTSPDNAKVLASAHTHRGYLLWMASRPGNAGHLLKCTDSFNRLSRERLEELASREFSLGGKYGNQTAQQLAVKTNPYAKLCGSIVKEAMQEEIRDFYQKQPRLVS